MTRNQMRQSQYVSCYLLTLNLNFKISKWHSNIFLCNRRKLKRRYWDEKQKKEYSYIWPLQKCLINMIKIFLKLSTHNVQENFYFIFLYREKEHCNTRNYICRRTSDNYALIFSYRMKLRSSQIFLHYIVIVLISNISRNLVNSTNF